MTIHQRLQDTKTRTLAHYSLADDQLDLRYGPDKWSVRFILHHLADAETVLFDRVRRVLSERRQVLWAFDQDAWARCLDYDTRPLALSRRIYEPKVSAASTGSCRAAGPYVRASCNTPIIWRVPACFHWRALKCAHSAS